MTTNDICPTCGTSLGPLHDKKAMRRCTSCSRVNPRGFYYCGYCATPMENTEHRAALSDLAAPEGGWPSLARELVEVRFFMDRGELDEAFELVAILRERYPGHPELADVKRRTGEGPPPDTQVNRVVDAVLSDSEGLQAALPRRAAPQWNAPESRTGDGAHTRAHEVVADADAKPSARGRKRVVASEPRQSFRAVSELDQPDEDAPAVGTDEEPTRVRMKTDRHAGLPERRPKVGTRTLKDKSLQGGPSRAERVTMVDGSLPGSGPIVVSKAEAEPVAEAAADSTSEPVTKVRPTPAQPLPQALSDAMAAADANRAAAPVPGMTVAVPTLQPASPYREGETGEAEGGKRSRTVVRKRALKARKRSGRQTVIDGSGPNDGEKPRRRRPRRQFGAAVLGRLGSKD